MIIPRFTDFRHRFATTTTLGPGGYEPWPVALQDAALAINVDDGVDSLRAPPAILSVNGGAADAVSGVDEYDWYLSQRTDDPEIQALSLVSTPGASSTITINLTAWWTTTRSLQAFPGSPGNPSADPPVAPIPAGYNPSNSDHVRVLYRHCYIYVSRKADKAWAMLDISKALLGEHI